MLVHCNLIGYVIYFSIDREWQNIFLVNSFKKEWLFYFVVFTSESTKTITLLALNFYEMIVDFSFAISNYHPIEILSS